MKDWEDLETGQEVLCDDLIGSHHGFNVGGRVWRYQAHRLHSLLLRIEDVQSRNIIHRALATADARRTLCKALPKAGRKQLATRFERDDVI
jgi:hypothetical protein